MSKFIPNYALYGDDETPSWADAFFFERIPQRAQPYNFSIRPHTHGSLIQILYLTRGSVEAVIDHARLTLFAPCLLVIPANTVHGWKFTSDVEGPIVTAAQRPLESVAQILMPSLLSVLRTPYTIDLAIFGGSDEILQSFAAIEREAQLHAVGHIAAGISLVTALAIQIARLQATECAQPAPQTSRRTELIEKFRALVEENFKEHWTLSDYAARLGITPGQLTRSCKELIGKSGTEIIYARLTSEAQRDLVYTANSIRQLAYRLGFADEAYFSRFFKKQTGLTPREFRALAMREVNASR